MIPRVIIFAELPQHVGGWRTAGSDRLYINQQLTSQEVRLVLAGFGYDADLALAAFEYHADQPRRLRAVAEK